jgi:hypothetical protein
MKTSQGSNGLDAEPAHSHIHDEDCQCGSAHAPEASEPNGAPVVDLPAPDAIVELCQQCVHYVQRTVGLTLDYSPETLPVVDHYLSLVRLNIEERPALLNLVANAVGAYFGELVRQRINGFWLMPTQDVHDWSVCARSVFLRFNPIGVAHEAIAQADSHPGPGAEFKLAREEQTLIAERLALIPQLPHEQYYLLSTRLETLDVVVETLRLATDVDAHDAVEFEPEDYE